ncbi:MAG: hypothetical protein WKF30_11770 [Pyrinomonadaceae bacterium]
MVGFAAQPVDFGVCAATAFGVVAVVAPCNTRPESARRFLPMSGTSMNWLAEPMRSEAESRTAICS